jgi:hypothetical protein
MPVTVDEVRAFASGLPRTTEGVVQGRLKFRVARLVYLDFSHDERGSTGTACGTVMGFAFPKEWREVLVGSDPEKFLMPRRSDLRYNWACVRLAAIDVPEMRELVLDAWAMVVPKKVVDEYAAAGRRD